MITCLLYHTQGIKGYKHIVAEYQDGISHLRWLATMTYFQPLNTQKARKFLFGNRPPFDARSPGKLQSRAFRAKRLSGQTATPS